MLLGREVVRRMREVEDPYRALSRQLTLEEWSSARRRDAVRRQRHAADRGAAVNRRVERVLKNSWVRSLAMLVLVLVVYFALPVEENLDGPEITLRLVRVMLGIFGAGVLVVRELHPRSRRRPPPGAARAVSSWWMWVRPDVLRHRRDTRRRSSPSCTPRWTPSTSRSRPRRPSSLGDVHAQGQVARALVTLQMAFSVGFLAAVTALFRKASRVSGTPARRRGRTGRRRRGRSCQSVTSKTTARSSWSRALSWSCASRAEGHGDRARHQVRVAALGHQVDDPAEALVDEGDLVLVGAAGGHKRRTPGRCPGSFRRFVRPCTTC